MEYAGFWKRFFAVCIDALILTIPGLLIGKSIHFGVGIGVNVIIGLLYYPIFESSELSATPGKALLNLAVLTEGGERISFRTAVLRFFCRYLSGFILCIGYIMQLFSKKRQTLHDILSETVVVNRKAEDLNYFKVWKEQLKLVIDKL